MIFSFFAALTATAQQQPREQNHPVRTANVITSTVVLPGHPRVLNTNTGDSAYAYGSYGYPVLFRNFHAGKVPVDYYTTCLGFFCKKELQIEKLTRIPFRFRLGSLEYCNTLEGR